MHEPVLVWSSDEDRNRREERERKGGIPRELERKSSVGFVGPTNGSLSEAFLSMSRRTSTCIDTRHRWCWRSLR